MSVSLEAVGRAVHFSGLGKEVRDKIIRPMPLAGKYLPHAFGSAYVSLLRSQSTRRFWLSCKLREKMTRVSEPFGSIAATKVGEVFVAPTAVHSCLADGAVVAPLESQRCGRAFTEPRQLFDRFMFFFFGVLQVTQAVANARQMAANRERMGGPEGKCKKRTICTPVASYRSASHIAPHYKPW